MLMVVNLDRFVHLEPILDQLHPFDMVIVYFYLYVKVLPCPSDTNNTNI
jgi:hypothetical protein